MYVDLVLAEARVYGDEHAARPPGTAKCASSSGGVLGQRKATRSPFWSPDVAQARGEAVHPLLELPVGVAPVSVDDGGLVREHVSAAPEEVDRRKLAAVDLLTHQNAPSIDPIAHPNYSTVLLLLFPILSNSRLPWAGAETDDLRRKHLVRVDAHGPLR